MLCLIKAYIGPKSVQSLPQKAEDNIYPSYLTNLGLEGVTL